MRCGNFHFVLQNILAPTWEQFSHCHLPVYSVVSVKCFVAPLSPEKDSLNKYKQFMYPSTFLIHHSRRQSRRSDSILSSWKLQTEKPYLILPQEPQRTPCTTLSDLIRMSSKGKKNQLSSDIIWQFQGCPSSIFCPVFTLR